VPGTGHGSPGVHQLVLGGVLPKSAQPVLGWNCTTDFCDATMKGWGMGCVCTVPGWVDWAGLCGIHVCCEAELSVQAWTGWLASLCLANHGFGATLLLRLMLD
jgi:hypothetical protein